MKQLDAVEALALLLHDRRLRNCFAEDPYRAARMMGLPAEQIAAFVNVSISQLNEQADSLLRKRMTEVAKLIPETWKRLGVNARSTFLAYAEHAPWPRGHRRHWIDADAFCRHLKGNVQSPHYLRSEHHQVAFLASERSFSFTVLRNDEHRGVRRSHWQSWGIQLCTRRQGAVRVRYLSPDSLSRMFTGA